MTDLVSLIKEAIMNAPTRSFDGKMNYQGMAEAAARVAYDEIISALTIATVGLGHELEAVRRDIAFLQQEKDKLIPPLT